MIFQGHNFGHNAYIGSDDQSKGKEMSPINHFTKGVRVANFSDVDLPMDHLLNVRSEAPAVVVRTIRRHADLPYVFVVDGENHQKATDVLEALKAIRSPCLPYALFVLNGTVPSICETGVDIVPMDNTGGAVISTAIDAYAASRLHFDESRLRMGDSQSFPETVDVVIVGGGITGIYAANRLLQEGMSFCVLENRENRGHLVRLCQCHLAGQFLGMRLSADRR